MSLTQCLDYFVSLMIINFSGPKADTASALLAELPELPAAEAAAPVQPVLPAATMATAAATMATAAAAMGPPPGRWVGAFDDDMWDDGMDDGFQNQRFMQPYLSQAYRRVSPGWLSNMNGWG